MPSVASHFAVAKKVSSILNINSDDFMLGNILPDIIDLDNSHFIIKGTYYLIPNINEFINNQNYDKDLLLGYLTHLLLDKYFLEEYIPNNISNYQKFNLFTSYDIYEDYSRMNYFLVNEFLLDTKYICNIILNNDFNLDKDKVDRIIECINYIKTKETKYIDYNHFKKFLNDISIVIANEIENILNEKKNKKCYNKSVW